MDVKEEKYSVDRVIGEAIAGLDAWAKTKSITLEKIIGEGIPEVNMDPQRIGQVLNNLIGNAIKFTPGNGTITIEASLKSSDRNNVLVSVKDTGPGIPKEDLSKVFDRFYQTGERNLTDISGTGVGLSIAKEIIELHNGKIWAESGGAQGAKFVFTLPIGD